MTSLSTSLALSFSGLRKALQFPKSLRRLDARQLAVWFGGLGGGGGVWYGLVVFYVYVFKVFLSLKCFCL